MCWLHRNGLVGPQQLKFMSAQSNIEHRADKSGCSDSAHARYSCCLGVNALHCKRCQSAGAAPTSLLAALQSWNRSTACLSSQWHTDLLQHLSCQQLTHFSAHRSACSAGKAVAASCISLQLHQRHCSLRHNTVGDASHSPLCEHSRW